MAVTGPLRHDGLLRLFSTRPSDFIVVQCRRPRHILIQQRLIRLVIVMIGILKSDEIILKAGDNALRQALPLIRSE
jgi:hypothetical protein